MFLKNDDLFITINDLIFRSHMHINPQLLFDPDAVVGFYDGVNVKRPSTSKPNQWGDFQETGFFDNRKLTLTGTAVADNAEQLLELRDKFVMIISPDEYVEIAIKNSTETRYITVTLDDQPSWVQKVDNAAVWKLDLYAPDPRMYGPIRSEQITDSTVSGGIDYAMSYPLDYGGGVREQAFQLVNNGNTDSWPKFIVTGDFFQGFNITNNAGKIITYNGVVTMSAPVTIDTGAGTAVQNGIDKSNSLSRRDWFSIAPKSSLQPLFLPIQDGNGWCDIIYRDTWV